MSAILQTAKAEIARDGYLSGTIQKKILNAFGLTDCLFALTCLNAGPQKQKWKTDRLKALPTRKLIMNARLLQSP